MFIEFKFYGYYSNLVGPKWKAFQQVLVNVATDEAAEDKMVAGAAATFSAMTDMFVASRASLA